MEKKPTKQSEKKPVAANQKLDDGLDEEEDWRKMQVENRDLYVVLDDGLETELNGMDATEENGVNRTQETLETSLSSKKEHKLPSSCLHSDSSVTKDSPFVRFVYSNKFEPKKFSVRTFPTVSQNQLQEYALISDFFIKDHNPSSVMISDLEHLQRDIVYKKLSCRDLLSFVMTPTADHEKTANRFNPAGYRYFTGAVIPEIMVYDKGIVVRHSAYFFESHYPFISLYRDLITSVIGDIQSQRQKVFKEIKARFPDDDYEPQDSLALGNRISVNWIARESRQGGFLDHLYNLNINEGLQLQRYGVTIKFQADNGQDVGHQVFHLLDKLPNTITPSLIASIMGGMLLEQVVVLHGASRTLIFEVMMFMLSLISPLQWPFPIVPLILSYHMRQYLDSPVPLLCGIEESPEKFELLWKDVSEQSPSVLHVQLDTGAVLGSSPLNFKEAVLKFDSSSNWDHCKKLHRHLFDPEKEASREKVKVEFVECFRRVLLKLYMAPLNLSLLEKDHSRGFLGILGNMREKSTFPCKVLDQFITGQIFHRYLETLQKSIS